MSSDRTPPYGAFRRGLTYLVGILLYALFAPALSTLYGPNVGHPAAVVLAILAMFAFSAFNRLVFDDPWFWVVPHSRKTTGERIRHALIGALSVVLGALVGWVLPFWGFPGLILTVFLTMLLLIPIMWVFQRVFGDTYWGTAW